MPWVKHPRGDWYEWWDYLYGAGGPFRWQIGGEPSSPQPTGIFSAVPEAVVVPPVISEIPETWDELEALEPELFEPILETRPGQIPDQYPQDSSVLERWWIDPSPVAVGEPEQPSDEENGEDDMAHDWGHLIRQGLGGLIGIGDPSPDQLAPPIIPGVDVTAPVGAGTVLRNDCDGMAWSGGTPPKGYKVVNSCGRGVLRKVRRRRRRRLLTASDSRDIATIVGLVGKGQMASSLINRR